MTADVAGEMARAAIAWLGTLTPDQVAAAAFPAPTAERGQDRLSWYYTPTDHGGLTFHGQTPRQQGLAMQLVSAGLSFEGYATVCSIMGAENILDRVEDFAVTWGRERGRDPQLFFLRVFGDPAGPGPWAWRFGGHHISLNFVIVGGELVSWTPSFLGLDPAEVGFLGPQGFRPLGGAEDLARELVRSLSPAQLERCVLLDRAISDIVSGNRVEISDGDQMIHMQALWNGRFSDPHLIDAVERVDERAESRSGFSEHDHFLMSLTAEPKGLAASELDTGQRDRLRELLRVFYGRSPDPLTAAYDGCYADDAQLDLVHLAWGGPLDRHAPQYFRLQGPSILVEYDNTQREGNHVHTVWRDPTTDFGLAALAALDRG